MIKKLINYFEFNIQRSSFEFWDRLIMHLSNFMNTEEPIIEYSCSSYQVGLSNHADFEDTMKFIEKTGAEWVITDNARGPHAENLAQEIRARLKINADAFRKL